MTQAYWEDKHKELFDDFAGQASPFSKYALEFFPKGGKLLEIGTGQGGDAHFFQSLGYEVIATDFSNEALAKAKEKTPNAEFINVDTTQGLPFPDQSFDVVYSHMALHYFNEETTKKIFTDIYRILKPGGVFATITNTMEDPEKNNFTELEPGFYQTPEGELKRYFSVESMAKFTNGLFETVILDNKGEAYKNKPKTLIRFIGKKK